MTYKLYVDALYGYRAVGSGRTMAWQLIRNKCHEMKKPAPTMHDIGYLRDLTEDEVKQMRETKGGTLFLM